MATPRAARPQDVGERIKALEDKVQTLTTALLSRQRLEVTEGDFHVRNGGDVVVSDNGAVRVKHPNGVEAIYLGRIFRESDPSVYMGTGLLIQDDAGRDILRTGTDEVGVGRMNAYDAKGNRVLNDDGQSGYGLSAPTFNVPLSRTDAAYTTTNTAWTSAYDGSSPLWNPRLYVQVYGTTTTGVVGSARVLIDGVQVGALQNFTGAEWVSWTLNVPTNAHPGTTRRVQVEVRRVSGSGSVSVLLHNAYGLGS